MEFWSGLLFASHAVAMAIFSPIWGSVADRYGRKLMVERAMFGGAVVIGAMGLLQMATYIGASAGPLPSGLGG